MRILAAIVGAALLPSCAVGTRDGPAPLAKTAVGGMWSSAEPARVNACLAQVQAAASPPAYGDPLRFVVAPANPKQTRYRTQVTIFGDVSSNRSEAEAAGLCL